MAIRQSEVKLIPGQRNTDTLNELRFGDGSVMSLRDLFGKRFEGSVITREFDLSNKPVQNFVRREFIYLSRSFYVASVLGENKNIDQARMAALEQGMLEIFTAVQTLVRTRLNEVSRLLQLHGADKSSVHTSRPMTYIVPVIHPRAYQFLELLREVDDLHSKREHAWILQHIDHTQRNDNFREVMKAVRRIGYLTRMNRIAMWKMLQRAADETGGAEGDDLKKFAEEQSQTLVAERQLDPDSAGSISSESALPKEAQNTDAALPAEVGAAAKAETSALESA